jgi:hypothetical protein
VPNREAAQQELSDAAQALKSPAAARPFQRRERGERSSLPTPPPFIIIGSQTILNTLHTNPSEGTESLAAQALD